MSDETPTDTLPIDAASHDGIDPVRLEKLNALRAEGRDPFAVERFEVTHHAADIVRDFESLDTQTVSVAGRVRVPARIMGKAAFIDLLDSTGRIQLYVRKDEIGDLLFDDVRHRLDVGDIVGIEGFVFKTKTGEVSVHVRKFTFLAKALRTLPFGKEYENEEGEAKQAARCGTPNSVTDSAMSI